MKTSILQPNQTNLTAICKSIALTALLLAGMGTSALAQDNIGGHIGVVLPLVTHVGGSTVNEVADDFSMGMPMGVTFKGKGRMAFDLEIVPGFHTARPRLNTLTLHPGLVWDLGHRFSAGMRVAFDVNSATWGFTPLINHSWPIKSENGFFKAYFVEAVMPVRFNRPVIGPKTDAVTFGMHFGVGF